MLISKHIAYFQCNNSDTAGTGVANYLAAFEAGVDIVDVAVDSMSGMTSQPTMGGVIAALQNTSHDTGIHLDRVRSQTVVCHFSL